MENKLFLKFSFYDQIGYLMVGAITVFVVLFNAFYFFSFDIPTFDLDSFLIWLVVIYFSGHFVQGIANLISDIPLLKRLIREEKGDFEDNEKEILQKAGQYFDVEQKSEEKLWNLCYTLASAKDITGQVQAFNAYYGLYRGWFVTFFLQSLFLFYFLVTSCSFSVLILLLASIFFTFLFHRRMKRFWKNLRKKVLETFIVLKTFKP